MKNLLDHGHIGLVDHMGSDLSIARNARISYDGWREAGKDTKGDAHLIKHLYKNGHNTPFESVLFTFDVKAPIFVFRQWHRHRTWGYNELSARYRELPEEFYIPEPRLIGEQSLGNKQCRDVLTQEEFDQLSEVDQMCLESVCHYMRKSNESSFLHYKQMIADKIPRELARSVLPVSTYSHMFATVNLHNLFKFLGERMHKHAQYEIRVYAWAMLELIEPIVPVAVQAFKDGLGEGYEF